MAYGAIAIPERLPAPRAVRATATMVAALAIGALVAIVLLAASAPRDDTALVQLHGRSGNWKLKMGAALRKHVRMQATFKPTKTKAHTKLEVHHEHAGSGSGSGMSMEELDQDLMKAGQEAEHKEHMFEMLCKNTASDFETMVESSVPPPEMDGGASEHDFMVSVYQIMKLVDKDDSGCVDKHEFHEFLTMLAEDGPKAVCEGVFAPICHDAMAEAHGKEITEEESDHFFDEIDQDHTGLLDYWEVAGLLHHTACESGHLTPEDQEENCAHLDEHHDGADNRPNALLQWLYVPTLHCACAQAGEGMGERLTCMESLFCLSRRALPRRALPRRP